MTIIEVIRFIKERVFLSLAVFCIVGIFSFVSFAQEVTTNNPAPDTSGAGTPHSAPTGKIERAGQATGKGIERAANATKRGVKRACEATGKGIKKAGEAIEKTFSGKD